MPINRKIMGAFLAEALKKLEGDWLILGGSVLTLIGDDRRVTVDIDIAGPSEATQKETLKLMKIAEKIGLAPEAINQAGAYFLQKIPNWKDKRILLSERKGVRLFRPNATLFIELKIGRLSQIDYDDCLAMINFAQKNGEAIDRSYLSRTIKKELRNAESAEKKSRLNELLSQVQSISS